MKDEARTLRKVVSFSPSEWKRVDDWMYEKRVRVEAEAIRQLIEIALQTQSGEKPDASLASPKRSKPA